MELDLNEDPWDQIAERVRRLEGVIFRARQRQRWRRGHTPVEITNFSGEMLTTGNDQDEGRVNQEEADVDDSEGVGESGCKRKASYLIAKALGMKTYANASEAEGCNGSGNFFDCNVCLNLARDPVLTCCGHLFCWPCFYHLPYAYSNTKECPVCNGAVIETSIIPIYSKGSVNSSAKSELKDSDPRVPARPRASRVESIGQRFRNVTRSTTVGDMMRLSGFVGGLGERVQLATNPTNATGGASVSATQLRRETENNRQRTFSQQLSRLLAQGATLAASVNSAMDFAERLFEELESYVDAHPAGQLNSHTVNRDSPSSIGVTNQSDNHTQGVAATNSAAASSVSPLSRNADVNAVTYSNIQMSDSSVQTISTDPSSSNATDGSR